jgi:hypothetical protein
VFVNGEGLHAEVLGELADGENVFDCVVHSAFRANFWPYLDLYLFPYSLKVKEIVHYILCLVNVFLSKLSNL